MLTRCLSPWVQTVLKGLCRGLIGPGVPYCAIVPAMIMWDIRRRCFFGIPDLLATDRHRFFHRPRQRHRIGAWFGLVALLGHLFVTLAQAVPVSTAQADPGAKTTFLVTCVTYGESENPDRSSCPVCQFEVLCQSLLVVADVTIPVPWVAQTPPAVLAFHAPPSGRPQIQHFARGPPSVA